MAVVEHFLVGRNRLLIDRHGPDGFAVVQEDAARQSQTVGGAGVGLGGEDFQPLDRAGEGRVGGIEGTAALRHPPEEHPVDADVDRFAPHPAPGGIRLVEVAGLRGNLPLEDRGLLHQIDVERLLKALGGRRDVVEGQMQFAEPLQRGHQFGRRHSRGLRGVDRLRQQLDRLFPTAAKRQHVGQLRLQRQHPRITVALHRGGGIDDLLEQFPGGLVIAEGPVDGGQLGLGLEGGGVLRTEPLLEDRRGTQQLLPCLERRFVLGSERRIEREHRLLQHVEDPVEVAGRRMHLAEHQQRAADLDRLIALARGDEPLPDRHRLLQRRLRLRQPAVFDQDLRREIENRQQVGMVVALGLLDQAAGLPQFFERLVGIAGLAELLGHLQPTLDHEARLPRRLIGGGVSLLAGGRTT